MKWEKNELKLILKSIPGEPLHLLFYDEDRIKNIKIDGESLKRESLKWVYDKDRNSSLIFHEFTSDTCEVSIKVKK